MSFAFAALPKGVLIGQSQSVLRGFIIGGFLFGGFRPRLNSKVWSTPAWGQVCRPQGWTGMLETLWVLGGVVDPAGRHQEGVQEEVGAAAQRAGPKILPPKSAGNAF